MTSSATMCSASVRLGGGRERGKGYSCLAAPIVPGPDDGAWPWLATASAGVVSSFALFESRGVKELLSSLVCVSVSVCVVSLLSLSSTACVVVCCAAAVLWCSCRSARLECPVSVESPCSSEVSESRSVRHPRH